jgi:hypothetical protein
MRSDCTAQGTDLRHANTSFRIQSMSNAHALLNRSHWHGVRLAELVGGFLA